MTPAVRAVYRRRRPAGPRPLFAVALAAAAAPLSLSLPLPLLAARAAPAAAAPGPNLLSPSAWQLLADPKNAALVVAPAPDAAGSAAADGTAAPAGPVLSVSVLQATTPDYSIQLDQAVPTAIPAGHIVRLRFSARAAGSNPARFVLELANAPYTSVITMNEVLTPRWRAYDGEATLATAAPAGTEAVRVHLGRQTGEIDIAGVSLVDEGVDPTLAAASAAVRPAAVAARIRRYRMADLTVRVVDQRGRPVRGARVAVRQTRHAFLFGSNIFGLDLADATPEQMAYRDRFRALFNYATLPFYWGAFETRQGQPDFARLQGMAQWCDDHGIAPKAHPLVWHQVYPAWAPTDPDATIPLLHRRVTQIVTRMAPLVRYYDVVNEASSGAEGQTPPNGESSWVRRDGGAAVVATALGWARAAASDAHARDTFLYNDYELGQPNVELLTRLQQMHALPDAIGIQSHMHSGVWPMTKVWATCERFAQFHRPLHFTETTVLSTLTPHAMPPEGGNAADWVTTPDGEAAQAAYVTKFYTVLFSYPALRAITWWDLSDKNAWMGAPAGLLRKDMTPKPAYTALLKLIRHDWWTTAAGRTDADGRYALHAYYGDYAVTVTLPGGRRIDAAASMPEAGGPRTLTVRAGS